MTTTTTSSKTLDLTESQIEEEDEVDLVNNQGVDDYDENHNVIIEKHEEFTAELKPKKLGRRRRRTSMDSTISESSSIVDQPIQHQIDQSSNKASKYYLRSKCPYGCCKIGDHHKSTDHNNHHNNNTSKNQNRKRKSAHSLKVEERQQQRRENSISSTTSSASTIRLFEQYNDNDNNRKNSNKTTTKKRKRQRKPEQVEEEEGEENEKNYSSHHPHNQKKRLILYTESSDSQNKIIPTKKYKKSSSSSSTTTTTTTETIKIAKKKSKTSKINSNNNNKNSSTLKKRQIKLQQRHSSSLPTLQQQQHSSNISSSEGIAAVATTTTVPSISATVLPHSSKSSSSSSSLVIENKNSSSYHHQTVSKTVVTKQTDANKHNYQQIQQQRQDQQEKNNAETAKKILVSHHKTLQEKYGSNPENLRLSKKLEKNSNNNSIDEEIRFRYQQYLLLEPNIKDKSKTDYTYAHSYSYSPLVPAREQYIWTVPNMSRQSIRHRAGRTIPNPVVLINENTNTTVTRRFIENMPISQISSNQIFSETTDHTNFKPSHNYNTRQINEHMYHSTPLKTSIQAHSNLEFSDDDENDNQEMNETIRVVPSRSKRSNTKPYTSKTSSHHHGVANDVISDNGQYSEEDDEEQITFIRRIRRYIVTTIRNTFIASNDDYTENDNSVLQNQLNLNQSSPHHVHHTRQRARNYLGSASNNCVNSNTGDTGSSKFFGWFSRSSTQNQNSREYLDNGGEKYERITWKRSSRWPWLCLLLLLLLLPFLFAYIFGSGSSSYYDWLMLKDHSKFLSFPSIDNSWYSNYLPSFSSPSSWSLWPKLPVYESLWSIFPFYLASKSSTGSHINDRELYYLREEISSLKSQLISIKNEQESIKDLNSVSPPPPPVPPLINIDELLSRISGLETRLESCCSRSVSSFSSEEIENRVRNVVDGKINEMQIKYETQLRTEIDNLKSYLIQFVNEYYGGINETMSKRINQLELNQGRTVLPVVTDSNGTDIQRMIKLALAKYDADKTGEADFALESSGAWIIDTRCSESFDLYPASYKVFGFTFWRSINSPRVVIQSGVVPGECWCFKGSEGRISIQLSARILPTAFSYEHIPESLSRDGHIKSAPKRFMVYGLKRIDDAEPELLGEYTYKIRESNNEPEPDPLQRFTVQNLEAAKHTFNMIELFVWSNHGHQEYTCLYRFRVHGLLPPDVLPSEN